MVAAYGPRRYITGNARSAASGRLALSTGLAADAGVRGGASGLAGKDLADRLAANDIESGAHRGKRQPARSVFHAWAMPD